MDYYQDMSAFWKSLLIAFIIFQIFILAIIIFKLVFWLKQNPPSILKTKFPSVLALKLIYLVCDVWSEIMFWLVFFTTAYWFVTYKLQANAFILLPSIDDWSTSYKIFDIIFGLILGFRVIAILIKIVEQSYVDIFLIDWERTGDPLLANRKPTEQDPTVNQAIVWRSIFVANEFNEMQTEYRYIRPETTLIWFAFFIKALGWE